MQTSSFIIYTVAILSFAISFAGFYFLSQRNEEFAPSKNTPFVVMLPIMTISFIALFFLLPHKEDSLNILSLPQIILPLISGAIIYFSSRFFKSKIFQALFILACCISTSFFIPESFQLIPNVPNWINNSIIVIALFIFTFFYPIINTIDANITIQSSGIGVGIFALYLIGATSMLLGAFGLTVTLIFFAFYIFNRYPAKLSLIPAGCNAIGYILGYLILLCAYEGSGPAAIILSMFFIAELICSILRVMFLLPPNKDLSNNTYCYQANLSGFPPYFIAANIFRLQIILVLICCFEMYAPDNYTVPVFSFIITLWYLSKIKNWQNTNKTIRELNQDLMSDIKNNINDIKEQINKGK